MRKGDSKLFLDKSKLYTLINLRINGYALTSLGILFGCDWSSVKTQVAKYGIQNPPEVYTIERIVSQAVAPFIQVPKEDLIEGVRINIGKNYKDYLKENNIPITKTLW